VCGTSMATAINPSPNRGVARTSARGLGRRRGRGRGMGARKGGGTTASGRSEAVRGWRISGVEPSELVLEDASTEKTFSEKGPVCFCWAHWTA
jgi:hypothetical protein